MGLGFALFELGGGLLSAHWMVTKEQPCLGLQALSVGNEALCWGSHRQL